jgi:hypothetical protein
MKNLGMCEAKQKVFHIKLGVGSLMYAMIGLRIDLAYEVNTLSPIMLKSGPPHWMVVNCIILYLKDTLDFKICLGGCLEKICNANWTGVTNLSLS